MPGFLGSNWKTWTSAEGKWGEKSNEYNKLKEYGIAETAKDKSWKGVRSFETWKHRTSEKTGHFVKMCQSEVNTKRIILLHRAIKVYLIRSWLPGGRGAFKERYDVDRQSGEK